MTNALRTNENYCYYYYEHDKIFYTLRFNGFFYDSQLCFLRILFISV